VQGGDRARASGCGRATAIASRLARAARRAL
jgi:hypothetical protein